MPRGRPEVGPKVETRLSEDVVAIIDRDANNHFIKRAEWLRRAALRSLPHETLRAQSPLDGALADTDGWLSGARTWARDAEAPVAEREFRGAAYAAYIHAMRAALAEARDSLPVLDARAAYAQAEIADPAETPELGRLWGRAAGVEAARDVLEAVLGMLPLDGLGVEKRAGLDDPQMDLEA